MENKSIHNFWSTVTLAHDASDDPHVPYLPHPSVSNLMKLIIHGLPPRYAPKIFPYATIRTREYVLSNRYHQILYRVFHITPVQFRHYTRIYHNGRTINNLCRTVKGRAPLIQFFFFFNGKYGYCRNDDNFRQLTKMYTNIYTQLLRFL